jgi:aspartate/methionine/tyrosine aminotransferase
VLEDAKKRNRSSTALGAGFPNRRAGLKQAEDCLAEAMAAHEAGDGVVEKGMQAVRTSITGWLYKLSGYYPEHQEDMKVLVGVQPFCIKYICHMRL